MNPIDLGAPAALSLWRPGQQALFDTLTNSGKRFDAVVAPTGVGKSLLGWLYARLIQGRAAILTSTKGLCDQYVHSFQEAGLVDVRGMGNYPCRELAQPWGRQPRCDEGPCLDGAACIWKESGCAYFDAVKAAREAQIVVAPYAFWFANRGQEVLGPRELLVLDEAHAIGDEIVKAAGAEFGGSDLDQPGLGRRAGEHLPADLASWREAAARAASYVRSRLAEPDVMPADRRKLRSLRDRFDRVARSTDDWAFDMDPYRDAVRFEPISPRAYAEPVLFHGIPKILLLSATLSVPALEELGLAPADYNWHEAPSPFPVARRPIYWLETGVRVTGKTSETNLEFVQQRMDVAIDYRLAYKGIIHAVSYARAKWIQQHSRHGQHMLLHTSQTARETVERFKAMPAPAILVSPSMHTGYDFPYDQARWQIIAKVPFPDTRFGIAAARKAADPRYDVKRAIATVVQMAGRVVRAADDLGETIIFDDSIKWLYSKYRPWFPTWFRQAFRPVQIVPPHPTIFA